MQLALNSDSNRKIESHQVELTNNIDILPALNTSTKLSNRGRGFLLQDAHVRARECS